MIHRLTEKDAENRTAVCAVCGPVDIKPSNGRYWQCGNKKREGTRRWMEAHPDRRSTRRSVHVLYAKDVPKRQAVCEECGPTAIVPYGRGWTCARGTVRRQEAPNVCEDCLDFGDQVDLVDGECPRCSRSLNQMLLDEADTHRQLAEADVDAMAFSIVGQWSDPYRMPDYETAVPGWTTLGARTPAAIGV